MFGEEPRISNPTPGMAQSSPSSYMGMGNSRKLSSVQKLVCLTGDVLAQIGLVFLLIGSIISWIFVPIIDFSPIIDFGASYKTANGNVTDTIKTNASEGGGKHSKGTYIYENHFRYQVNDKTFSGISYSKGKTVSSGDSVKVKYNVENPQRAKITGMRQNIFPFFTSFVLIFPLLGLGMLFFSLRSANKTIHLLSWGRVATGTYSRTEWTNVRVNKQRVAKYYFTFSTETGVLHEAIGKTHRRDYFNESEGEQATVLYDPKNPALATLVKTLPAKLEVDDSNQVRSANPLPYLILPTLVVVANAIALYIVVL